MPLKCPDFTFVHVFRVSGANRSTYPKFFKAECELGVHAHLAVVKLVRLQAQVRVHHLRRVYRGNQSHFCVI